MSKMRQTIQLKDTNIEELEVEKEKLKSKISINERNFQDERDEWKRKFSNMEIQFESKIKQANQYSKDMKSGTDK